MFKNTSLHQQYNALARCLLKIMKVGEIVKVYCQMDFVFLCCWHGDRLSIIIIGIILSASIVL